MISLLHFLSCGAILSLAIASPLDRFKRQVVFPDRANQGQFGNPDPSLVRGPFTGFGGFEPGQNFRGIGSNGLTIPGNGGSQVFRPANAPPPIGSQPGNGLNIDGNGGLAGGLFQTGFEQNQIRDNRQVQQTTTPGTTARPRTTPSQAYFACLQTCRTTQEYNPVCGDDGQNYHNMQRLQCAQRCGAAVTYVRNGTCLPL